MIKKMFGETEAEQYRYLRPRIIALIIALCLWLPGLLLGEPLAELLYAGGIAGVVGVVFSVLSVVSEIGSILFAIVMLVFGWAVMRALFGYASVAALFSNNIVFGVVIGVIYLLVGYFAGMFTAVVGLCRYFVLLKHRKR